jgi:hypothetical protein
MTPTTKQITIRIPLPIMEAIARRCDQTGQDRSAVIVEALAAGLGAEPNRDRIDSLEERVTALEAIVDTSQTESRKVTRRASRTESQSEPRVTHPEAQAESRHDKKILSYSSIRRRARDEGTSVASYAAAHGYQKQGSGNRAVFVRDRPWTPN